MRVFVSPSGSGPLDPQLPVTQNTKVHQSVSLLCNHVDVNVNPHRRDSTSMQIDVDVDRHQFASTDVNRRRCDSRRDQGKARLEFCSKFRIGALSAGDGVFHARTPTETLDVIDCQCWNMAGMAGLQPSTRVKVG